MAGMFELCSAGRDGVCQLSIKNEELRIRTFVGLRT
jgi:hypothetical protein